MTLKLTAKELIELLTDASMFRLCLDRLSRLEAIASEPSDTKKHDMMMRVARDTCMWVPHNPSADDFRRLYSFAREAVLAEGAATTAKFRKKWGIEIATLELPE